MIAIIIKLLHLGDAIFATPAKEAIHGKQPAPDSESSQATTVQQQQSATDTPTSLTDESAVADATHREQALAAAIAAAEVSGYDLVTICPYPRTTGRPKHHLKKMEEPSTELKCSMCSSEKQFNKVKIACINTSASSSKEKCSFNLCMPCYKLIVKNNKFDDDVDPASNVDDSSQDEDDNDEDDVFQLVGKFEDSKATQGSRFIWVSPFVETKAGTSHKMKYYPQVVTISFLTHY
jgi:hypothetical protein